MCHLMGLFIRNFEANPEFSKTEKGLVPTNKSIFVSYRKYLIKYVFPEFRSLKLIEVSHPYLHLYIVKYITILQSTETKHLFSMPLKVVLKAPPDFKNKTPL